MAKKKKVVEEDEGGMDLDDAFGDDEDVEYAEVKPKKKTVKKAVKRSISNDSDDGDISIKSSKDISKLKKGDKVKIDGIETEIDTHYVLMDHGNTREMAIECFDPKKDKDYQIRYFADRVESSIEVFELVEIMYSKMDVKKVEW